MRILFVTEQFPYPLHDGGNLRTYHVLRALAAEHQVTLVSHGPKDTQTVPAEVVPGLSAIHCVAKPGTASRLMHAAWRVGIRALPLFALKNWSAPLLAMVDQLLATEDFDAIHFNHLDTACYALRRDWTQRMVFDTHNCLSAMAGQVARDAKSPWRRSLFRRESKLLARCELAVGQRMDVSLVCSSLDAQAFQSLGVSQPLVVVPNGVDTDYFSADPLAATEPGTLVFTGAMNYYPNEQAVLWFCREILPLLADVHPVVQLVIVGKNPTPAVQALENGTSIRVTGAVPDVRKYVRGAALFVVPLRHGSGTRLKILEAFSMGKAVVSTRIGAEGIAATEGEHLALGDTPQEFAAQVRRLLADQATCQRMGQQAQQLARSTYSWARVGQDLLAAYAQLNASRESVRELARPVVT